MDRIEHSRSLFIHYRRTPPAPFGIFLQFPCHVHEFPAPQLQLSSSMPCMSWHGVNDVAIAVPSPQARRRYGSYSRSSIAQLSYMLPSPRLCFASPCSLIVLVHKCTNGVQKSGSVQTPSIVRGEVLSRYDVIIYPVSFQGMKRESWREYITRESRSRQNTTSIPGVAPYPLLSSF
jgi:hypothetical protein